jgi:hypothetical protein
LPTGWKLTAEPIYNNRVAQLSFNGGLTITVQPDRILLVTDYLAEAGEVIGEVVAKYVSTMKMGD